MTMPDEDFNLDVGETEYKGSNVNDDRTEGGSSPGSAVAGSYTADEEDAAWHADDVEGGISWMVEEYIRLSERLDEGQGEWPKPGYTRNDVWERLKSRHSTLRSALNRLGLDTDKIKSAV
jgi:hypothetical protein